VMRLDQRLAIESSRSSITPGAPELSILTTSSASSAGPVIWFRWSRHQAGSRISHAPWVAVEGGRCPGSRPPCASASTPSRRPASRPGYAAAGLPPIAYREVALDAIRAAPRGIAGSALGSPLVGLEADRAPGAMWLTPGNLPPIGSFERRGASNAMLRAPPEA